MRILVLKPSSLGDIIHALPVAQSIRDQLPEAEISWVVKSRFADLVRRCPTVNGEIIEFPHQEKLTGGIRGLAGVVKSLRGRSFDCVLDFQGLFRTGLMTWAVRSPKKIGSVFAREGSRHFYTELAQAPSGGFETHAVEKLLQFLTVIGLEAKLRSPIEIQGDDPGPVDARLNQSQPIVMIPNSRGAHKEWKYFPELTSLLLDRLPNESIAWDSHIPWGDPATDHLDRFINLTSKTSLMQMIEVIRRAKLVIANDSGPLHIAAAFGKPTLALFGPTLPQRFGPYPMSAPQNHVLVSPDGDLSRLSADVVADVVAEIVGDAGSRAFAA